MRAGRYSIIVGLLVLISSLAMGSHAHVHPGPHRMDRTDVARGLYLVQDQHPAEFRHLSGVVKQGESSDPTRHERRHGKSLVSQAIVTGSPVTVLPDFTYCHRNYSLFLPGGCIRQFTGNFSLRGPPVC